MKKVQVYLTIFFLISYAVLAPMLRPTLDLFWLLLMILAILALLARNYVDLLLITLTALNMFSHMLLYPALSDSRHLAQTTAFTAFTLLNIALIMGPIAKLSKRFAPYLKHRRHVGVSVFLLAFIHANFIIKNYYNVEISDLYAVGSNFFGTSALMILGIMALTSMNYFQHKMSLKSYNFLHTGFLLFYLIYTFGLVMQGFISFEPRQAIFAVVFTLFALATAPWSFPQKIFLKVNGWKQLHYMIYVAYLAVIIHAWTGYFILENTVMQILFWIMITSVILTHLYGWLVRIKKSRELKQRLAQTS